MTRWCLDTEFNEDGRTIELISIGLVSEFGDELYFESSEFDHDACQPWVKENVFPYLQGGDCVHSRVEIAGAIALATKQRVGKPEFWAYFADYDWVVLCQLYGRMVDLPSHFPMYCLDLKQEMVRRVIDKGSLPKQIGVAHNALEDARWVNDALTWIERSTH